MVDPPEFESKATRRKQLPEGIDIKVSGSAAVWAVLQSSAGGITVGKESVEEKVREAEWALVLRAGCGPGHRAVLADWALPI